MFRVEPPLDRSTKRAVAAVKNGEGLKVPKSTRCRPGCFVSPVISSHESISTVGTAEYSVLSLKSAYSVATTVLSLKPAYFVFTTVLSLKPAYSIFTTVLSWKPAYSVFTAVLSLKPAETLVDFKGTGFFVKAASIVLGRYGSVVYSSARKRSQQRREAGKICEDCREILRQQVLHEVFGTILTAFRRS